MGGTQMKLMARDGAIGVRVHRPLEGATGTARGSGMHSHDSLRIRADPQHRGVIWTCGRPDLTEGVWIGLKGNRSYDSWRNRITKGIGGMLRLWHASEYITFRMRRASAGLYERVSPES
jgi:hypothetical protein